METSRRNFIALAGIAPVLLLGRNAEAADPCYNPATLPMSQKNLRRSVEFQEVSSDPKRRCGACAFFVPSKNSCGTCKILSGGQVAAASVCVSFAPKA